MLPLAASVNDAATANGGFAVIAGDQVIVEIAGNPIRDVTAYPVVYKLAGKLRQSVNLVEVDVEPVGIAIAIITAFTD